MESVSVVVPAFNAEAFVGEALQSVIAQTHKPLEVIVVDDGSTDNTASIVQAISSDAPFPVTLVRQSNKGLPAARNAGIRRAKGKWIAFLDADDVWKPNHLLTFVQHPPGDETYGLLCTDAYTFSDDATTQKKPAVRARALTIGRAIGENQYDLGERIFEGTLNGNFIPPSCTIVRRSAGEKVGWFDPLVRIGEDRDFFLKLALCYRFVFYDVETVGLRIHADNLSTRPAVARGQYLLHMFRTLQSETYQKKMISAQKAACKLAYRQQIKAYLYAASRDSLKALLQAYKIANQRPFCRQALNPRHFLRFIALRALGRIGNHTARRKAKAQA